jgi:RNA polymerase sigma factor (TIGR02999 family)
MPTGPGEVTRLLLQWNEGKKEALEELLPLVYRELRKLAARSLRSERLGHTLQPTALVHEAYQKLIGPGKIQWQNRAHFFAVAAGIMRRILVDHARRHAALRRGGGAKRLPIAEGLAAGVAPDADLIAVAVTVTFASVSAAGNTTLTTVPCPTPPTGYVLGSTCFDISTTASFSTATVCVVDPGIVSTSRLLHASGGLVTDVTDSRPIPTSSITASAALRSPRSRPLPWRGSSSRRRPRCHPARTRRFTARRCRSPRR